MVLQELYLCIRLDRYHFLKFILEGYDGLCLLSSVPGHHGCVCLRYPDDNKKDIFYLLSAIASSVKQRHTENSQTNV